MAPKKEYKLSFSIANATVKKIWDDKQKKLACDSLKSSLDKALKPLNKITEDSKLMQQVPRDVKEVEFTITPVIESLMLDDKKKPEELSASASAGGAYKGKMVITKATVSKTFKGVSKKIEGDIKDMMQMIADDMAKLIKSQI